MNLALFALFSQKIPIEFLHPQKKKFSTLKNLSSLALDFLVVATITWLISQMFSSLINLNLAIFTRKFVMSYPLIMSFIVFPLALMTYYTICLYACDGMTWGSKLTKQRILSHHHWRTALQFTLTQCTLGGTYFLVKDQFEKDDYRYENLMMIRDEKVDLHALIKTQEHEDHFEEFRAA